MKSQMFELNLVSSEDESYSFAAFHVQAGVGPCHYLRDISFESR